MRDGASALYGSVAIAGVINSILNDNREGGSLTIDSGEFFEGEQYTRVAANGGFARGDNRFLNVSFESVDNDALSRGIQRPVGQGPIDAGVPNVGSDSLLGDAPFVQTWGRPDNRGARRVFPAAMTEKPTLLPTHARAEPHGYAHLCRHRLSLRPIQQHPATSQDQFPYRCPYSGK